MDGDLRDLVASAAAGDRSALERLLRRIDARVLHLCHRLLCDVEDARDVRQWVLLKVARSLGAFSGEAAFETWLHRIVVNACRDRQRERATSQRAAARAASETSTASETDSADALARSELSVRVVRAVAALPAEEREVVVLRHFEGLRFPRIAEVLGVPETTLKSRFQRALTKLAHSLPAPARRGPAGD
jgi:RNA polymerase sigma-70 factor, ECF subfamily